MATPWDFILRKRPGSADAHGPDVSAGRTMAERPVMQSVGEKTELLHVRFSYMADRLEDLKSLSDDFNLLSKPIEELSTELPRAKGRVLELEALLRRESEERARLQKDLAQSTEKLSVLSSDYQSLFNSSKAAVEEADAVHAAAAADRTKLAETQKLLGNVEQQIAAERDQRERLQSEVHDLTAVAAERALEIQKNRELAAQQGDRNTLLEREVSRLQGAVDKQVVEGVDLQTRLNETERLVHDRARELAELQQKLDAEQTARQQREHANGIAVSALTAEKTSLGLQLEAMTARVNAAEHLVSQSRQLLSEKDAAARNQDGVVRHLEKQCEAAERQNVGLEQRLNAKVAELAETQRSEEGLSKRCDMLTKALSAKEAALANANDKARARSERVEELTRTFEVERSALETSHRRLMEELENERAERTMAQGALNIARENRASLQRLNESLKRANRSFQPLPLDDAKSTEPQSNVSFLPVGQKPAGDDQ